MLVTLEDISEASFHLTGTSGFLIEAENAQFCVVGGYILKHHDREKVKELGLDDLKKNSFESLFA